MTVDFAAVQWARRMAEAIRPLRALESRDLRRLVPLMVAMTTLEKKDIRLTDRQLTVILQNTFSKDLVKIQADKGGALVEFTGGGFEYERFLVRPDGRVPNSRYEAEPAKRKT
jgi:hypothetical protein